MYLEQQKSGPEQKNLNLSSIDFDWHVWSGSQLATAKVRQPREKNRCLVAHVVAWPSQFLLVPFRNDCGAEKARNKGPRLITYANEQ